MDKIDSSVTGLAELGRRRNQQLEAYFRRKLRKRYQDLVDSVRLDTSSLVAYEDSVSQLRENLLQSLAEWEPYPTETRAKVIDLGKLGSGRLYRLQIWITDDVEMPALMLVPRDGKLPRPTIVCLHGYEGSPEWVMGFDTPGAANYMNAAGLRLSEAGYVVVAPHIVCSPPGFGKDRIRFDRLARLIGKGLLGFEIFELRRVIDYLETRQDVLPGHIGIFGISQGGQNALFLAALDTRIAAVIVSGYFNNRWNKMLEEEHLSKASRQERQSYVSYLATEEDDKFNPFLTPLFPDHILGALICPRPLMVQIGRKDPIVYWRDAVKEFELVRKIYSRLGIAERAHASVVRLGGHEMFIDEAKGFLDRWLSGHKND